MDLKKDLFILFSFVKFWSFKVINITKLGIAKNKYDSWLSIAKIEIILIRKKDKNFRLFIIIKVHNPYKKTCKQSFLTTKPLMIGNKLTSGDNKKILEKTFFAIFKQI